MRPFAAWRKWRSPPDAGEPFDAQRHQLTTGTGLSALYYPYARTLDATFLKQNLLLFDRIIFSDPLGRAVRESFWYVDNRGRSGHKRWDAIKDDYAFLEECGAIKVISPFQSVREFDGLLAQAMICDLKDEDFMRLCSELASQDYWGILRGKIPPDTLLANALQFSGTRFWQTPREIMTPPEVDEFHVRHYGTYEDFSSPFIMAVEHDYIPVSCGYSVNINVALLLSELNDYVPMTDDIAALRLVNEKYARASKFEGFQAKPKSIFANRSPEFLRKLGLVGINILNGVVSNEALRRRSFKEIIEFRVNEGRLFERFQGAVLKLTSTMQNNTWDPAFEENLVKLIDKDIFSRNTKNTRQLTKFL